MRADSGSGRHGLGYVAKFCISQLIDVPGWRWSAISTQVSGLRRRHGYDKQNYRGACRQGVTRFEPDACSQLTAHVLHCK